MLAAMGKRLNTLFWKEYASVNVEVNWLWYKQAMFRLIQWPWPFQGHPRSYLYDSVSTGYMNPLRAQDW